MEKSIWLRFVMMVMIAAMVQRFALVMHGKTMLMIVVIGIGLSSMLRLLKLMDDLEGILMIILIEVVVVVVRHVTMGHEPARRVPETSMTRDNSAEQRMWVAEGAFCKWTTMSMRHDVRSHSYRSTLHTEERAVSTVLLRCLHGHMQTLLCHLMHHFLDEVRADRSIGMDLNFLEARPLANLLGYYVWVVSVIVAHEAKVMTRL